MFDPFCRASKPTPPTPSLKNPGTLSPPSYQLADTGAVMAEKKMILDPELKKGCPYHLRFNPLRNGD